MPSNVTAPVTTAYAVAGMSCGHCSATLTRERLDAMIEEYYEARGLDTSGLLRTGQMEDLRLGVVVQ